MTSGVAPAVARVKLWSMTTHLIRLGALFAAVSVAAGAFGAHALRSHLDPSALATFETAARYQMYHAFGLFATAWVSEQSPPNRLSVWASRLFVGGVVLFCGSLYALSLTGAKWLGAIAPVGGASFLAGWCCLALGAGSVGRKQ